MNFISFPHILEIVLSKLESFLDFAIQSSALKNDPNLSNISINLEAEKFSEACMKILDVNLEPKGEEKFDFGDPTNGFDLICLEYAVSWPLSIVLNERVVYCCFFYIYIFFRHTRLYSCSKFYFASYCNGN